MPEPESAGTAEAADAAPIDPLDAPAPAPLSTFGSFASASSSSLANTYHRHCRQYACLTTKPWKPALGVRRGLRLFWNVKASVADLVARGTRRASFFFRSANAQSEFLREADHYAITLSGRLLQVPKLVYGGRRMVESREGAWNVLNSRLSNPKKMKNWGVLNFDGRSIDRRLMKKIIRDLVDCCRNLGMEISQPPQDTMIIGVDVKRVKYSVAPSRIEMIVVLLPAKADGLRTKAKYYGDSELGIYTNCLRQDKVRNATVTTTLSRTNPTP
ncbi:hypothetical protein C8J57DRAFT_1507850 [Mycena rebaudengoi]|nr:hypothetical protein C8J57DRAFT_1507850 [Mycena rebaudengoi]